MKTYVKWVLPVLVVGLLSYLAWGVTSRLQRKDEVTHRTQKLPDFKATSIAKTLVSQDDFQNKPAVLLYFDPDCEHCQREADELRQQAGKLTDARY